MQTGFFLVLCNYIRFSTHLCVVWKDEALVGLLSASLWLYFLSACVRALGSVSSLSVVRRSILRALYLAHLWAFCSKASTGCHIPVSECEKRHTHSHTDLLCATSPPSLNRLWSCWLMVKEAKLITVGNSAQAAVEWFNPDCLINCFNLAEFSPQI